VWKAVFVFFQESNSAITLVAQQAPDFLRSVIVVDVQILKKIVVVT